MTVSGGTGAYGTVSGPIVTGDTATYTVTFTPSTTTGSPMTITADFAADSHYNAKSGTDSLTVNPAGPGPLHHFDISAISTPQTAGTAITGITITAKDSSGATVTSYVSSTILTETDGGAGGSVTQSPVTFANGVWSGSLTLTKSGTGVTITASGGGKTGVSNTFTVNPGSATSLTVSGFPSSITAGTAGSVTVTAKDANGNTATGYGGTVKITSTDGQAVLPANYAFLAGDNGVHQLSVTLKTAGTQSITATDTGTGSITGSQTGITVNAAAATKLAFIVSPTTVVHGHVSSVFTVQRQDQYGNPTPSWKYTSRLKQL